MANLFQKLELEAFRAGITPRTQESRNWFRRKAQQLRRVNRRELLRSDEVELRNRFAPGKMYLFYYDPKTKDTLPYYDGFPLVIPVDRAEGGFYGMNLHYLPPVLRAKFLDSLMDITTNKKYDESTRFRVTYETMKRAEKFRFFKPCVKRYLVNRVRSRFVKINADQWDTALFLPTERFRKKSKSFVLRSNAKPHVS